MLSAAQLSDELFISGGQQRHYLQFSPGAARGTAPQSYWLVLKETRAEGSVFPWAPRLGFNQPAVGRGAAVLYPEPANGSWHHSAGQSGAAIYQDLTFLSRLLTNLRRQQPRPTVYLVGVGLGGALAYHWACATVDLPVQAMAIVSSAMDRDLVQHCAANPPRPLLLINRSDEPLAPFYEESPPQSDHSYPLGSLWQTVQRWRELGGWKEPLVTHQVLRNGLPADISDVLVNEWLQPETRLPLLRQYLLRVRPGREIDYRLNDGAGKQSAQMASEWMTDVILRFFDEVAIRSK